MEPVKTSAVDEHCIAEWARRAESEYVEMPGLNLTRDQMRRLWSLDPSLCDAVVDALVASGFLLCRSNNTYVRTESR